MKNNITNEIKFKFKNNSDWDYVATELSYHNVDYVDYSPGSKIKNSPDIELRNPYIIALTPKGLKAIKNSILDTKIKESSYNIN